MQHRSQRTIRRSVELSGVGFFTGAETTVRFLPAEPNYGIRFQRIDIPGSQPIPATIEYAVARNRRTALEHQGAAVELTEHVLAAFAGLQIDNCLVEMDAPELPGMDGSSQPFVEAIQAAEWVEQSAPRALMVVEAPLAVEGDGNQSEVTLKPSLRPTLAISYQLDYGPRSPIPPQNLSVEITPASFLQELAFARTFVLHSEVEALRKQGYGRRTTAKDLIVIGDDGKPVENSLRAPDEFVRHKILDCLGDFALLGCDVHGHFSAYRSGHHLNREMVRQLRKAYPPTRAGAGEHAA